MTATERVRYTPDPENPNETLAIKEAWVEAGWMAGWVGLRYLFLFLKVLFSIIFPDSLVQF